MIENLDKQFMQQAIELALQGKGFVSPNPLVGAVIVRDGQIIGSGYHAKYGGDHAEIAALSDASGSVRGATLYCNLEPCCHTNKQTPPCAQRLIAEGISRVVIASLDPNPDVNGQGIEMLKEAGIEVDTGLMHDYNLVINQNYFHLVKTGRPRVVLKMAQSVDGRISGSLDGQTWLTGRESVQLVHEWRSEFDVVLVGAGTINADDPQLNVREYDGRDPGKVILSGNLSVNPASKIFQNAANSDAQVFLLTSDQTDTAKRESFSAKNVNVLAVREAQPGLISCADILDTLTKANINSVLVEGGSQIFSQFVQENAFDEIRLFISPIILGKGVTGIDAPALTQKRLHLASEEMIGNDILLTYHP